MEEKLKSSTGNLAVNGKLGYPSQRSIRRGVKKFNGHGRSKWTVEREQSRIARQVTQKDPIAPVFKIVPSEPPAERAGRQVSILS